VEGLWDLGPEPKGNLVFTFTLDPLEYKKEINKLAKEAASDPTNPADPAKLKPVPKDTLTE